MGTVSTEYLWNYLDLISPRLDMILREKDMTLGPDDVRRAGYELYRERGGKPPYVSSPLSCQRLLNMYMGEEVPNL